MASLRFPDSARRARLATRQALHPAARKQHVVDVVDAMTVLHATEPPTVHLSVNARLTDASIDAVEAALYSQRTVVKQLAMRRTLFGFPRDLLPATLGSASARVAQQQRAMLAKDLVRHGVTDDGDAWIDRGASAVLERLAGGVSLTAKQLRDELPELAGRTVVLPDAKSYVAEAPFAPRLLTLLGVRGDIVRGANTGHWRVSRPEWTLMETWLGEHPEPLDARAGYAELVGRWLRTFGPGTENDLVWWLGATKSVVRQALADVDAVAVQLDSGSTGYVLPGDERPEDVPDAWAALLPVLDPTTMGYKDRDFYLRPEHVPNLFDRNGNGGSTAWFNGEVVGCWVQDAAGHVRVVPMEKLPSAAAALLDAEAERLDALLNGVVISSIYKSSHMSAHHGK